MRDIKFRAWNKKRGNMVDLLKITPLALHPDFREAGIFIPFSKDFIIEQFTGLLDKNGKEIYEGDIVNLKVYLRSGDIRPAVVICESLGYMYLKACDNGAEYGTLHIGEVIGNIHENPELLSR